VYALEVSWSEGTSTVVYRRYSDFFEFQVSLILPSTLLQGAITYQLSLLPRRSVSSWGHKDFCCWFWSCKKCHCYSWTDHFVLGACYNHGKPCRKLVCAL